MGRGLRLRIIAVLLVLVALPAAYLFWFRDSGLVAVEKVEVTGLDSTVLQSEQIEQALISAGHEMTTLRVRPQLLDQAVQPFPEVRSVEAEAGFPSKLTVQVTLRRPVARIGEGEDAVAVAGDGVVLPEGSAAERDLPLLPIAEPPEGGRVGGPVLAQTRVLAAAPRELTALIDSSSGSEAGPVVNLEGGIELRFGDDTRASEKWEAAVAVLTDPDLETLDYVDLSSPGRPATGGTGNLLPALP